MTMTYLVRYFHWWMTYQQEDYQQSNEHGIHHQLHVQIDLFLLSLTLQHMQLDKFFVL